ncbi:toll/interleukin-1 receptor domain-containing protein [Methylomicrobium sp. Wu6]|uniref:toll/interleukin-1 receptor domain-containing protein n=1 Tax=Methylomicrobium sp. Wu6 TaxID=3107928 RepID=UPI002DD631B3|nr:toll/interleukin-1 receptor domain-containing protein [Methylomicrobium sp. Wu6]MEC4747927.1 toll/interleukin-1 receptor domain-containing protein [Methylomicrobium sp. Wu6]
MTPTEQSFKYAVFVSYAHIDDSDGWVTELISAIEEEHSRFSPVPLLIFFDRDEIQTMADWEHRILTGLRDAELMLVVVSPAYFESRYCRKEWEIYLEHELDRAFPGEGVAPVYIVKVPSFETGGGETQLDKWIVNLRQRQYLDLCDWYGKGPQALALKKTDLRINPAKPARPRR